MFGKFAVVIASFIASLGVLISTALAHHSMAGFDRTQTVMIEGTVKEFSWTNPHCWIELESVKDGKPITWNFEMTAPAYLVRAGWKKTSLKPGMKVTVTGSPLRSGEPGALFVSVKFADGTVLLGRAAPADKGKQ